MGNPIRLDGKEFRNGFGTHAPSLLYIKLGGDAFRFRAIVGVDDEEKKTTGSVIFSVFGDGELLCQTSKLISGGVSEEINVNLVGFDTLLLVVDGTGDGINYDHADWADAYFLYRGTKPVAISRPIEPAYILTPKAPETPRINGPKVYGTRPGHDFIYRIPATGDRPMKFSLKGLPKGLALDKSNGIITGKIEVAGRYETVITAKNSKGSTSRKFTIVAGNQIALTPPLGWNSWNCFACAIDQEKVKAATDAMVNSGLADYGWSYINIDDCWMIQSDSDDPTLGGKPRDENGNMKTNKKFPDIKALTDYVHSKGLKIGIYSGPGPRTCAGYTACYQHEEADAKQFADWGFDYLKYDWCDYERIAKDHSLPELKKPYLVMRDALEKSGRDIVYSLCQYGMGDVWRWGAEVGGNCWRTTGDITDNWASVESIGFGQAGLEYFAGPGHWNDPDMLVVGKVGWGPALHPTNLSPNEQYTHISLWALLAAPLLIGCDMTQLDDFTFSLLTNNEVLDINQDPLGMQAGPILKEEGIEIWARNLEDGSKAVGLFNRGMRSATITLKRSDLNISGDYTVRDVWKQEDIGPLDESYSAEVPSHGVKLLKIYK
jgi:alpha-galactosidase